MSEHVKQLLLATNNPGKIEEFRSLLQPLKGWQVLDVQQLGIDIDPLEDGKSYRENALIKALAFSEASGLPVLADDSGLEVEALDGAPGLISARFSPKKDARAADRRRYLLELLAGKARPWRARFVSTICLAGPSGSPSFTTGECWGEIVPEERGMKGFGYDPIFLVKGTEKTMAEMDMTEKNQLSHRALATQKVISILHHFPAE